MSQDQKEMMEFIEAMRKEYGQQAFSAPSAPAESSPYLPFGDPRTGFTGNVGENEPAGIVHGKEQVIEAPLVKQAGGPGRIREHVEELAGEASERGLPGFKAGTGFGTVPNEKIQQPKGLEVGEVKPPPSGPQKVNGRFATPGITETAQKAQAQAAGNAANRGLAAATAKGPTVSETIQQPKGLEVGEVKPPVSGGIPGEAPVDPPTPPPDKGVSPLSSATTAGLKGIQDIAAGESESQRILERQTRERQAGRAAVQDMSLAQSQAQRGVEGGVAAAEKARLGREQRLGETAENVELARQRAASQEKAQETLFQAGMSADKFNEAKRQFGEQFDLSKDRFGLEEDKFKEFIKQTGIENTWREHQYNSLSAAQQEAFRLQGESQSEAAKRWADTQRNGAIKDAINLGDYNAVKELYGEMGINMDTTKFETATQAQEFGNAVANMQESVDRGMLNRFTNPDGTIDYDAAINSPEFKAEVERAKKAQGMTDTEATQWAKDTLETSAINNSPFKKALQGISPEEMTNFAALNGIDVGSYSFAGVKGEQGLKNAIASLQMSRALGVDSNGDVDVNDSPQWERAVQGDAYDPTKKEQPGTQASTGDLTKDTPVVVDKIVADFKSSGSKENALKEVKNLTPNQWDVILSDPNEVEKLKDIVPTKTINQDMVFRVEDAEKLGLKFDSASSYKYYRRTKDIGKKNRQASAIDSLSAGDGNGSVVLHKGTPYRLIKYSSDKQINNAADKRRASITALNLLTNEEEDLFESTWKKI